MHIDLDPQAYKLRIASQRVAAACMFHRTKVGAYKCWELERCFNCDQCPLDHETKLNLKFLIELRHEIEHQMTMSLDSHLSGRYQACALNYNRYIKESVTLVVAEGQGHNFWKGFFRCPELIAFAIARARSGAAVP